MDSFFFFGADPARAPLIDNSVLLRSSRLRNVRTKYTGMGGVETIDTQGRLMDHAIVR